MVRQAAVMMLATLAMAGCAKRGGPYGDLEPARHAVDGLLGRQCHYVDEPLVPATIDVMTRPGTRGALLFWGRDATPADTVELSVRYGDDGYLAWVRAIRSTITPDRVAELERIVSAGLAEEGPPDWGMRLLILGGQIDAVLPAVQCRPEPRQRVGQVMGLMGTAYEMQEARQARGRQVEMVVSLDAVGRILNVRVVSGSGSRLLDQYAIDLARAYSYEPKLHDGLGVPSTLPLRFRMPRR